MEQALLLFVFGRNDLHPVGFHNLAAKDPSIRDSHCDPAEICAALIFGGNVWDFLSEIYDGRGYVIHIREAETSVAPFGTGQSITLLSRSIFFSPAFFFLQSFASANTGQDKPFFASMIAISNL
jgi:hypothetical protein